MPARREDAGARFVKQSYYLEPEPVGRKAFSLLKTVLAESELQAVCKIVLKDREVLAAPASTLREQDPHGPPATSAPQDRWETTGIADLDKTHDLGIEATERILHIADIGAAAVAETRRLLSLIEREIPKIEVGEPHQSRRRRPRRQLGRSHARTGKTGTTHLHPKRQGQRDHPGNDDNYAQYEKFRSFHPGSLARASSDGKDRFASWT